MFKALFSITLFVTLVVNILFLLAAKEKPPDLSSSTFVSIEKQSGSSNQRRLFLRSNDFHDYSPSIPGNFETSNNLNWENFQDESRPETTVNQSGTSNHEAKDVLVDKQDEISSDKHEISLGRPTLELVVSTSSNANPIEQTRHKDLFKGQSTSKRTFRNLPVDQKLGPSGSVLASKESTNSYNFVADKRKATKQLNSWRVLREEGGKESGVEKRVDRDSGINKSRVLNIRVKSSRNHVFVSVDNVLIYESLSKPSDSTMRPVKRASDSPEEEETSGGRGIHVIVLNEHTGSVMAKRVFDTYSPQQDEELCLFLNMIREGRILVLTVKDEASFKMPLNSPARELLQRMGSRQITRLRWRDMWALVVRKVSFNETGLRVGESQKSALKRHLDSLEARNFGEALTKSSRFSNWAAAIMLEVHVELIKPFDLDGCKWNSGDADEDERRAEFCSRVEGYGRVCDCDNPTPISFRPARVDGSSLNKLPVVVMASNRPYYLYRMLRSLLAADGANASMVTVSIDGFYDEPLLVSRLFNLRAIQRRPRSSRSARISHHYKSTLTATFDLFPEAEFVIIIEEDLDVGSDALIFFDRTLEVLRNDPTLYCVSAWNDQGYEHSANNISQFYRVETMPGLGWMLSRDLYKHELEPNWPSTEQQHDWDMWIRLDSVRKNRECIIPDISRTYHFGSTGTNINSYFQRQYFSKHAFNRLKRAQFGSLDHLMNEAYEHEVERLISEARALESNVTSSRERNLEYLCQLANLTSSISNQQTRHSIEDNLEQTVNNVIYLEMIDKRDFSNWLKLAKCWHIWDLDARGQHKSMWRLYLDGRHTFVVGTPASSYSRFKPANLKPFII